MSSPTSPHAWEPLTTRRLLLREYTTADAENLFILESNADNARYQTWGPWTRERARESVAQSLQQRHEAPRTVVELAVVWQETGEFLGRVGARVQRLDGVAAAAAAAAAVDDDATRCNQRGGEGGLGRVDLWFSFLPGARGRGFATEAVGGLVRAVGVREGEGVRFQWEIECEPRNEGSARLAERLGFERVSLTERAYESKGEWVGSLVYRKVV